MPYTPDAPRLYWETHGESGPPVLMIMGLGMSGRVWRPQVEDLSADHRLVTFDNPGIGQSEDHGRSYEMADLARDALRVADAAGFGSFHLIGVSMGGMIAQHVALAERDRLRSLTLIATQPGGRLAWLPPTKGVPRFLRAQFTREPKARQRALERLLYPEDFTLSADQAALAQRMADMTAKPAPPHVSRRQVRAVMRHNAYRNLSTLNVPTLVVQPGRDVLVDPRHSERLAKLLPNVRLERFDDAGHGIIFQSAARLNPLLRSHVAAHEAR